ncbi:MAG: hypothetical protein FJ014_16775, partial [Chloroflexi bacterium]|nr:hypothetical protein [Chloroflexota bacterium]
MGELCFSASPHPLTPSPNPGRGGKWKALTPLAPLSQSWARGEVEGPHPPGPPLPILGEGGSGKPSPPWGSLSQSWARGEVESPHPLT